MKVIPKRSGTRWMSLLRIYLFIYPAFLLYFTLKNSIVRRFFLIYNKLPKKEENGKYL